MENEENKPLSSYSYLRGYGGNEETTFSKPDTNSAPPLHDNLKVLMKKHSFDMF